MSDPPVEVLSLDADPIKIEQIGYRSKTAPAQAIATLLPAMATTLPAFATVTPLAP